MWIHTHEASSPSARHLDQRTPARRGRSTSRNPVRSGGAEMILRVLALLLCASCQASFNEAIAKGDYEAARRAAHDRAGPEKRALDEWLRAQAKLTLTVKAEDVVLPHGAGTFVLPLRVGVLGQLSLTTMRPHGYHVRI